MSGTQVTPADVGMASTESDILSLIITRPEDTTDCPFWIGLYKKGEASARDVFTLERIEDVFKLLTERGLDEKQALMLSDSSGQGVRQFYLVPETLCRTDRQEAKILILKTIEALKPSRIGIYFGIDAKNPDNSRAMLEEILIGLARTGIRELFLFTGNLGVNTVLNAALRVKHGLAGSKELQVFH
jgi:hypothetical protein